MKMENKLLVIVLLTFSGLSFIHADDPSYDYEYANEDYCVNGAGITCDPECKLLGNCIQLGGRFAWILIENCTDGLTCDVQSGKCVNGTGCPSSSTDSILCNEPGEYPNPYDCKGSFYCLSDHSSVYLPCNVGESYNACTRNCESSTAVNCHRTNPVCNLAGEFGVIEDNKRYFYYCLQKDEEILPSLLKCEEGHVFSNNSYSCVSSDQECTSESGTTTTTQTSINCLYTGQRLPHSDCRKFYECDEDLKPTEITCTSGSHYDPGSQNCVNGACS